MTDPWWKEVRASVGPVAVLEAAGIEPTNGRGNAATWAILHGMCPGQHGDGRGAIYVGTVTRRLHCRKCGQSFGPLGAIGLVLGRDLPPSPWSPEDPDIEAIRAEAEAFGWCTLRSHAPAPRARRIVRLPQPQQEQRPASLTPQRIANEWVELRAHAHCWRHMLRRWCEGRGWPRDIIDAIVGVGEPPVANVAIVGPPAPALRRLALGIRRPLVFAVRDAKGAVRSVSRRWIDPGPPTDGFQKAMALSAKTVGRSREWGCRAFGSIPAAVDALRFGGRLLLVEGSPDYLVAQALVRLGYGSAVIGAEAASGLKAIGKRIAEQVHATVKRPSDIEVLTIPDVKLVGGRRAGDGLELMRAAARTMRTVGMHVLEIELPLPEGRTEVDLADVATMAADAHALGRAIREWAKAPKGQRRRTGKPRPTLIGARVKDAAGRLGVIVEEINVGEQPMARIRGADHRERLVPLAELAAVRGNTHAAA